jgi:hypothetical protein
MMDNANMWSLSRRIDGDRSASPLKVDGMNMPGDERDHALLTAL